MVDMVRRSMDLIGAQLRIQEANLGLASVMHDRLITQIADFEKGLGPDEELGGYLASFGREILVRVAEIGYHNPYFLVFHGEEVTTGARQASATCLANQRSPHCSAKASRAREAEAYWLSTDRLGRMNHSLRAAALLQHAVKPHSPESLIYMVLT